MRAASSEHRRVVVVTGAALGIGRAIAERLAAEGWAVVGVDINREALDALATRCGNDFTPILGDVVQASVLVHAADAADRIGRLVGWVNNAAVEIPTSAHTLDEGDLRRVLDVDLVGVALGCGEAVRRFRRHNQGGSIVNLSSIQALQGFDAALAYQAAKGGVSALSRQVAIEYARDQIRCNCVLPGAVDTEMTAALLAASAEPDALMESYRRLQPIGRMIQPEEVAAAVWFLLGDESSAITGIDLRVDGGSVVRGGGGAGETP